MNDYEKELPNPTISLEDLIDYIKHGREIEFSYQGQSYFIDHSSKEGRTVWIDQTAVSRTYKKDFEEHLSEIILQDKSIADIFRNREGIIVTIL